MTFASSAFRSAGSLPTALLAVVSAFAWAPIGVGATASLNTVLAGRANLTTFSDLVKDHADVFSKLPAPVTVIAPNDAAYKKLGNWNELKENKTLVNAMMKYHILPTIVATTAVFKGESIWSSTLLTDPKFTSIKGGQRLILTKQPAGEAVFTSGFATRGTVVVENLEFEHGLVQVVDSVMRIPENFEQTARNAYTDLTAFLGALYKSGLTEEVIFKEKDITIFAPHNSAFQHLSDNLESMKPDELKRLLRYHIVPRRVAHVWELKNNTSVTMAEKGKVRITRHHNNVFVNAAQLIQTDILISNGVVHMIDNVLDPAQSGTRPDVDQISQSPVIQATGTNTITGTTVPTPFTSYLPCTVNCPVTKTVTKTPLAYPTSYHNELQSTTSSGGVAAARCTGLVGAGAVGLAAVGAAVVAGL
ncbi:FAS1 domain-containing protein [Podospora australis]|uniref:FAS1 domain-containing protein n=1 Tax=Podospora australis TaxID=1536484 RepID=A0AAN6WMZ6_9PEZI|nr:FAS1 domain-containing protein [Podospora australis]